MKDQFVYHSEEERAAIEAAIVEVYPSATFSDASERRWEERSPAGVEQREFICDFHCPLDSDYIAFLLRYRESSGIVVASDFVQRYKRRA